MSRNNQSTSTSVGIEAPGQPDWLAAEEAALDAEARALRARQARLAAARRAGLSPDRARRETLSIARALIQFGRRQRQLKRLRAAEENNRG